MKVSKPVGFAALLDRMPQKFVAQHKRVQERARRRREAQAKRLCELDLTRSATAPSTALPPVKSNALPDWQDTVADFTAR